MGKVVSSFRRGILIELPKKVTIRIRRIATDVKPTFASETLTTPTKTSDRIATGKMNRIVDTRKLRWKWTVFLLIYPPPKF
jgi:hypothetical protein